MITNNMQEIDSKPTSRPPDHANRQQLQNTDDLKTSGMRGGD